MTDKLSGPKLQNEKLGILKRTITGAVEHSPNAVSWVVRFSGTDVSYILEGLDEVAALEQRVKELKDSGSTLRALLRQAKLFKGYDDGPLDQPAVEVALRDWCALATEEEA